MGDNRPAVYLEGDTVIYRASALGHCLKMLWAARSDMDRRPIPAPIQKAMDEGSGLESTILNMLYEEHHWGFANNGQQFQVELNVGAWNGKTLIVRGKMDEIRDDLNSVDVKAFSQSGVEDWMLHGPKDYYLWQQSVYAHGLDRDYYYMPIFNKETGEIEPGSLHLMVPKYTREQIRDRVLTVEEAFYNGIMPTECPNDYACQYPYLHDEKVTHALPQPAEALVNARIKLSEKIKVLDTARKKLDEAITPKLAQSTTYHYNSYTITVSPNPNKFNTNAAKAILRDAGIDYETDELFIIPGVGTKVTMTRKRQKND